MKAYSKHFIPFLLFVVLTCFLQNATAEVYVKLFPGKELCVSYEGFRNPEEDPPTAIIRHRAMDPRNVYIRTNLFAPGGKQIHLEERIDVYGSPASIFFKVEETGTYRLCLRTPLNHPPLRFDIRFTGENDLVVPATTLDGAQAVDKPVEEEDYHDRLHILDLSMETVLDEVRMCENRLYLFDRTTQSTHNIVVGSLALNVILAIALSLWSEKYLERFFVKKKVV